MIKSLVSRLLVSAILAGSCFSAEPTEIKNKRELRQAMATANNAEEHARIAQYFRIQAQKYRDKEVKEQELVDYFAKHPSSPKYPTPYEMAKRLADYYSYAADQASAKALVQDKLAATARHGPQTRAGGPERKTKGQ
jgi:hypothetical protein